MENKTKIDRDGYGYYITINEIADDTDILYYLDITKEFYFEKGKEFGEKYFLLPIYISFLKPI